MLRGWQANFLHETLIVISITCYFVVAYLFYLKLSVSRLITEKYVFIFIKTFVKIKLRLKQTSYTYIFF